MPMVMLGKDLRIRRFTPTAEEVLRLRPGDVGRPLADLKPRIDAPDLDALVAEVLRTGTTREREARDREGRWHSIRLRPYRSLDGRTEGVVLCLVDIDDLRQSRDALEGAHEYESALLEIAHEPLLVLDHELRVLAANPAFHELFRVAADETLGRLVYDLGNGQWSAPALRRLLKDVADEEAVMRGYRLDHEFPNVGRRVVSVNARQIRRDQKQGQRILLAFRDITAD
jgi:two-component system CheB/CheR fusion protein